MGGGWGGGLFDCGVKKKNCREENTFGPALFACDRFGRRFNPVKPGTIQ